MERAEGIAVVSQRENVLLSRNIGNKKSEEKEILVPQRAIGWSEETLLRMDARTAEDHSYVASLAERKRYGE